MKPHNTPQPNWVRVIYNAVIISVGVLGCWSILNAAAPLAGTLIQNQAAATYQDSTGTGRTATSNLVTTEIQYVPAFTLLTNGQSKQSAPGDTATFPHVLTNTGNGTETYTLTVANGTTGSTFNFDTVAIYADADQNGVADNSTDLHGITVTLAAGEQFFLVAAGTVPGGATNTQTDTIVVGANDDETSTAAQINTDTVTVSEDAVVAIRKSASIATGAIGATITYRLEVTNTGNKTATHVLIYDAIPAGTTYKTTDLAEWSNCADKLTDSSSTEICSGITYEMTSGAVKAVITSLPVNSTQYITFDVTVNSGTLPIHVDNYARLCYNDGGTASNIQPVAGCDNDNNGVPDTGTLGIESNHVPFDVVQTAGVDVNDNNPDSTDPSTTDTGDTPPVPGSRDEVVKVASANPGDTVAFDNVITNTGIGIDTFNITLSGSSFPAGTTFQLLKADGSTTLTDTNGDSIPDTGPLAASASYHVVVNAVLPPGVHGNGPYNVVKTATSVFDPTKSDTVTDRLGKINYHELTLTPNGTGQIYPGGSIVYTHTIENIGNVTEGGSSGSVTLANTDNVSSPDWNSVLYYDADSDGVLDASELAAPITDLNAIDGTGGTNSGLDPGERATLFVKVFAPASAAAGDVNVTSITAAGATIATVTATDVTTIVLGQLRLYKTQALDAAPCDGTADAPGFGSGQISAKPGDCILYNVEARNEGFDLVKEVVVSDSIPANTTYGCSCTPTTTCAATVTNGHGTVTTEPTCGQTGIISATMGEDVVGDVPDNGLIIPAGGSETLTFGVKINQ